MLASDFSRCPRHPTFIEVLECTGKWRVRVVEQGHEIIHCFEIKSFALAYAEGQRIRRAWGWKRMACELSSTCVLLVVH